MKNILFAGILSLCVTSALAAEGSEGVGGGDLCENQFQIITKDLQSWINKGGHEALRGIPSDYSAKMLTQIDRLKVTCVKPGDKGHPVQVNGTPKVCRFDRTKRESRVTCDYHQFQALKSDEQYVLAHHEVAGLAGIESPNEDSSNYIISNQISAFLEFKLERRLVVRPPKESPNPEGWEVLEETTGHDIYKSIAKMLAYTSFKDCEVTYSSIEFMYLNVRSTQTYTDKKVRMMTNFGFYTSQATDGSFGTYIMRDTRSSTIRVYHKNRYRIGPPYFSAAIDILLDPSMSKIITFKVQVLPALVKTTDIYGTSLKEKEIHSPDAAANSFSCHAI